VPEENVPESDANGPNNKLSYSPLCEATMSTHAFEVLSRARNEIEVCHTVERHRFKFFVVTNPHGKRVLSESVEVVAKEGATHTPEFFSGSARAFAITWPIGLTRLIEWP
jgi:hypothetical protein